MMSDVTKRMAVLYAKIGLQTSPDIIEARTKGVGELYKELKTGDFPELLRVSFGLRHSQPVAFLEKLSKLDATFDVQSTDQEAALLASALIRFVIENQGDGWETLSLFIVTASVGGLRKPRVDDQLLLFADESLVRAQSSKSLHPSDRKYSTLPDEVKNATQALDGTPAQPQNIPNLIPNVTSALKSLGPYAEGNALAAARSDNEILRYVRNIQRELDLYWWATSGWSSDANRPFREFEVVEAALRAAKELADKTYHSTGLFAAPAILDMVIGRRGYDYGNPISLSESALASERHWRTKHFSQASTGVYADLMPVVAAMGLAAVSDDQSDWKPRFEREVSFSADTEFALANLSLQLYRETLLLRSLAA